MLPRRTILAAALVLAFVGGQARAGFTYTTSIAFSPTDPSTPLLTYTFGPNDRSILTFEGTAGTSNDTVDPLGFKVRAAKIALDTAALGEVPEYDEILGLSVTYFVEITNGLGTGTLKFTESLAGRVNTESSEIQSTLVGYPGPADVTSPEVYIDGTYFSLNAGTSNQVDFLFTAPKNIAPLGFQDVYIIARTPGTAVPAPSGLVLLGIGGTALAGYGWRRRRPS